MTQLFHSQVYINKKWKQVLKQIHVHACSQRHYYHSQMSINGWANKLYYIQMVEYYSAIFAWNVPLVSLIFLKRSLVFPILLSSSISLHWSLRKDFFTSPCYSVELCIQMGISFLFSFAFHFSSFLSCCEASSDNHFVFLHFFFLGMVLIPASRTMSWTSIIVLQALYWI